MNLNPDSPEITAYALGELPAAEMEAVAALVASDPSLQAEVEAIQACARSLEAELAAEPAAALSDSQRSEIEDAAGRWAEETPAGLVEERPVRQAAGAWWRWLLQPQWSLGLAGAAAVVLALSIWPRSERKRLEGHGVGVGAVVAPASDGPVTNAAVVDPEKAMSLMRYGPMPGLPPQPAVMVATASARRVADPAAAPLPPAPAPQSVPPAPVKVAKAPSQGRIETTRSRTLDSSPSAAALPAAGLAPAGGALAGARGAAAPVPAAPSPAAANPYGMDPVLMKRYGLVPREKMQAEARSAAPMAAPDRLEMSAASARYGLPHPMPGVGGESYQPLVENPFRPVTEARLSTFGIDVDTASYANVRRFLSGGQLPPPDAVRVEEMINYFRYAYPEVRGEHPIAARVDVADSPWKPGNRLVRVALKARDIPRRERPAANLVFLVDTSGSMEPENKLPLVQRSLRLLVGNLTARDHVSIVTYAGEAGVALPPSKGSDHQLILQAIDALKTGGGTHGSAGIRLAYQMARTNLVKEGVNRVILCTDGDFNVGVTSRDELLSLIEGEAKTGVFLTVLGYGMGNYKDSTMELLADRGNGAYAYIDSFREAKKVLADELESTLVPVAKDVKFQIEFNPAQVVSWRLIGYENRVLANRDFNDDTKDAGDLGAGHAVTALYEIVPVGSNEAGVDSLRYVATDKAVAPAPKVHPEELLFLKLRYKLPDGDKSRLMQVVVPGTTKSWEQVGEDFRFTAAVAGFALLLRDSQHKGSLTWDEVLRMAERGMGEDREGYRAEFIDLVRRARQLRGGQ